MMRAHRKKASSVDQEERFTALYRAHYGAVLCYARRRTDPDTARDVAAEVFLVTWRRLAEIPADPAQVQPWLYGVARRTLANSDRSRRRAQHLTARLIHHGSADWQLPDPADAVAEQGRLRRALDGLRQPDQEALRLVGWEELDLAGAAVAMGCSRSVMAVRLHRARRRLASALRALEPDDHQPSNAPSRTRAEQELT
jgi:RNA polymerase sigma-70 factor (ECF subfamily)